MNCGKIISARKDSNLIFFDGITLPKCELLITPSKTLESCLAARSSLFSWASVYEFFIDLMMEAEKEYEGKKFKLYDVITKSKAISYLITNY